MILDTWSHGDNTPFIIDKVTIEGVTQTYAVINGWNDIQITLKKYTGQADSETPISYKKSDNKISVVESNIDIQMVRDNALWMALDVGCLYEAYFGYQVASGDEWTYTYLGQIKIVAGIEGVYPLGGVNIQNAREFIGC